MFAKQIVSEAEMHGFCARIVDLQDVVDNDDFDVAATHQNGGDEDEDAALLRRSEGALVMLVVTGTESVGVNNT